jgi:hypothetical protein
MAELFSIDSVLVQGKDYQTPVRTALKIEKIGTNATSDTYLEIDNKPTGAIVANVAPIHRINTNLLPLLDLENLFYVIPPETKFRIVGATGAKFRVKGKLYKLAVGESLPADLLGRYNAQFSHYLVHFLGTYSHGTDVKLVADGEVEIFSLTPKTIEEYIFNKIVEASVANYTAAEHEIGIRFFLDNSPLDAIMETTKIVGIDIKNMPRPPAETTNYEPFSLKESAIRVLGDHTIAIKARNIKGADISPSAGTSLTFNVEGIAEYIRK